ncbi:UDP-4-amino-4,6-dideoxy-N-acetyl-beta-L-altrosamine N-acetyltransferase [Phenylobacterium montanum]|uniref:UDP-4-amino-4, 6-dideoxy-N-acetyl-beta-L-altrosamine N-acetyltransferase n=1 Tax=Phenylobacterium montanum TaxID=2823693 RepID=A0A975G4L2_9CAUL|nr:UDP-4-amino-4,6-dideoxy-N-acetyl-beta-L-altrosamine N-acetyltransferase [Caulobacter sp. S6]QUD89936.1 UDP-4-amino-4,6-dideoxy-N-acetyl-beta-L-altrosamine N-acetyltransferase [Caulobacter sp. S6]
MSVTLRPVTAADSDRLLAWRNSPAVSAYMYTDHLIGPEEHARWLAGALTASDRRYWIIEDDGAPVGLANLVNIDLTRRRCEWAYYLGEASVRGRGVGAAVELLVLDYVFGTLKLNKLWCEVLLENEGVWKLHQSFGFEREALYRQHVFKAGRFQDVVGLGLLAADWEKARPACAERLAQKGYGPSELTLIAEERG